MRAHQLCARSLAPSPVLQWPWWRAHLQDAANSAAACVARRAWTDQDGDGRKLLLRGGGAGVRSVPHSVHGGVPDAGGGGASAHQGEGVQGDQGGVQGGEAPADGGGGAAGVQGDQHGRLAPALQGGRAGVPQDGPLHHGQEDGQEDSGGRRL